MLLRLILLLFLALSSYINSAQVHPSSLLLLFSLDEDLEYTDGDYGFYALSPNSQVDEYYSRLAAVDWSETGVEIEDVIAKAEDASPTDSCTASARSRRGTQIEGEDFHDLEANEYIEYRDAPASPTVGPRPNVLNTLIRRYVCFCLPEHCYNCLYCCCSIQCCIIQSIIPRLANLLITNTCSYNNNKVDKY